MEIAHREYGDTTRCDALVILHGLFGSADNWHSFARTWGERHRVYVPDLPNHGSSGTLDDLSYHHVAREVADAIREARIKSATLLGHSMGGKIAMAIALVAGDLVDGVVVADIAPKRYAPRHQKIIEGMKAVAEAQPVGRASADRILAEHESNRSVRAFLLKSWVPLGGSDNAYHWQIGIEQIAAGYREIVDWPPIEATYEGPVLAIRGGASDYIDPDDETLFRRWFPKCDLKSIYGVSHWLHVEKRDTFVAMVDTFLATRVHNE